MPELQVLAEICNWLWLNWCNLTTSRGWSLYLSRSPAAGRETTCWFKVLQLGAGEISQVWVPQMAPTTPTAATTSSAQLHSFRQGPWEMNRNPGEPLVLLGKQKVNPWVHSQGPGLTYLPLPLDRRGVEAGITCPSRKMLPLFHLAWVSTALGDAHSLLENIPCCSCCHGATRGHQTSLTTTGEGQPRSPACSFQGWTTPRWLFHSPSSGGLSLPEPWKRHSYLKACNFSWLLFPEIPQIEHPCSYRAQYG